MHEHHPRPPRNLQIAATVGLVALAAIGLVWLLLWVEVRTGFATMEWLPFAVVSAMLLACQMTPATWIQFGPVGTVTPLWMFGYTLMLLGSPSAAVGVALLGSTLHAVSQTDSVSSIVLRVGGSAISLASAGLVLLTFGVRGAITRFEHVPWAWMVATVAAGVTIMLVNWVLTAITVALRRRVSLSTSLRRGLGPRITAEGAMLSLAPIWVIGIDFSLVVVPLLGITTVLVFRSTREALQQAHEARHDPLTGLLNRTAYLDQLQDALTGAGMKFHPTVLLMDLNGFKQVNDRLGHQIGDTLLIAFADRLAASLPSGAIAARLGGDEFAVLIPAGGDVDEIDATARELHTKLIEPLMVEGFPVSIGVSVGVSFAPEHGRARSDLLRAADVAMYKAKRCGTFVERYDNCVQSPQRGRLGLLADLGDALEHHQLHINFQPQLHMSDGRVDSVEALIRWHHPEHGTIPPNDFIGLAEQTDLIRPITELVLRIATAGMLTHHDPDVKLAVNVSARSLLDPYFADHVLDVLAETGFEPDRLELEVTERDLVTNVERTSYTIGRLRHAGVRIAIDDFGAGYSSYQTLRLLAVDRLKIDRGVVKGLLEQPRDQVIVASLIALAHELGLDVVAEGVESVETWDVLAGLGCDLAQGHAIATPMTFPDLRGWLTRWNNLLVEELVE